MSLGKEAAVGYVKQTYPWTNDFIYSTHIYWAYTMRQAPSQYLLGIDRRGTMKYVEYSRSWLQKRDESKENSHKESSVRTIMNMKNLALSQGDSNPISSPSPCKILCSSNCFITPWLHQGVFYTDSPFTPACICLHTTKDVTVFHLTGWHCWLFIYLSEGLLSSTEHSSNGDSLR